MARGRKKIKYGVMVLLGASLVAGCATGNRKVTMLYQPVGHYGTGAGELYLAWPPGSTDRTDVQWVVGTTKNDDGETKGDIVSPIAPTDLVIDALKQELTATGYTVSTIDSLPPQAARGVVVAGVDMHLDDVTSLVKEEAKSRIIITLELWKNGDKFKKLLFEADYSDFAVKNRDQLLSDTLKAALQGAMEKAIPEIIAAFEH